MNKEYVKKALGTIVLVVVAIYAVRGIDKLVTSVSAPAPVAAA